MLFFLSLKNQGKKFGHDSDFFSHLSYPDPYSSIRSNGASDRRLRNRSLTRSVYAYSRSHRRTYTSSLLGSYIENCLGEQSVQ